MGKTNFSPMTEAFTITQWNCTAIGSCSELKINQWLGSGAARAYGEEAQQSPPEWEEPSGYISGHCAIGSQINSPSVTMIFSSLILRTWSRSPLTRLAADRSWLACAFLLLPPALRVAFSTDTSSSPAAIRQAKIANFSLKEQRRCCKCRAVFAARAALHADDGHSECVSCLGKLHAEAALTEMEFSHCVNMSIASLCARIAFFSESNSVPSRPPVFFLPGTCEEKTAGQRDFALCCERAHAGSDPRVPRSCHAEMTLPSSLNTRTSITRLMQATWFNLVPSRMSC